MRPKFDVVVAGTGIIGLAIARSLLIADPKLNVLLVEKESSLAAHASGRNSGVLHAGFYYSPDSLKAKFCRQGNRDIRDLAARHSIPVREVGKVVVARNQQEFNRLKELHQRGLTNGVELELLGPEELGVYEPLATTTGGFLWSPTTAVSDPQRIVIALAQEVEELGAEIRLGTTAEVGPDKSILLNGVVTAYSHFVNAAGSQSDRIAHAFDVGSEYSMIPFIGIYRAVDESALPLKRLVYPVPHPLNPFLGVHFTLTVDGKAKIGPTAIPVLGREQYSLKTGWVAEDVLDTLRGLGALARHTAHDLPALLKSELPKVFTATLIREAQRLVPSVVHTKGWIQRPPGIRAQLVHRPTGKLEQDFLVMNGDKSTHVLNAVSPGWTSALPFGDYVSKMVLTGLGGN